MVFATTNQFAMGAVPYLASIHSITPEVLAACLKLTTPHSWLMSLKVSDFHHYLHPLRRKLPCP